MDKPLYILIFLLLWSNRIRGGEKEDINGSFSPSTQTTGVRNSLIDKASTSSITKKASIFDPDSESSETVSPPIKSKTLETNTGTVEPSVLNSNAPIPAKDIPDSVSSTSVSPKIARESTRKNTTTLSDTDSDSSETNSPPIKSEETKTKPGAPEIFLPSSVTIKPARDSTTVNTTESDPDSDSTQTRTRARARLNNNDFESPETDSASITSEILEKKIASTKAKTTPIRGLDSEPPETDSTSIKSKAPETVFGTQQPSFHNFESHELADESSETNTPPFISEAPEINPASTTKAKTATVSDPNSDNPEPSFINFEIHEPSKASTTSMKIISDSKTESSEVKSTFLKSKTSKTTTVDLRRFPRSSDGERDINERSNTNTVSAEIENPRSTKDTKRPSSNQGTAEATNATTVSTQQTGQATTVQGPSVPECNDTESMVQVSSRTSNSITFNLTQLSKNNPGKNLCVKKLNGEEEVTCKPAEYNVTFEDLTSSTLYNFTVFSYIESDVNRLPSVSGCPFSAFTRPRNPVCNDTKSMPKVSTRTSNSITFNLTQLSKNNQGKNFCVKKRNDKGVVTCKSAEHTATFQGLTSSTLYNFTVFSYIESDVNRLLSDSGCPFSAFTRPTKPNCDLIVITNQTTDSIVLDLRSLSFLRAVQYFVQYNESGEKNYAIFSKEIQLRNISSLQPGTSYEFDIVAVGQENITSLKSCKIKNYTFPGQPQNQSVKRTSEEIYLQWSSRGHVEYYKVSAWCNKFPKPTISHLGNETTANITGLMPGTHCSVIIIGFAGGFPSIPLNYTDIETIEQVPGEVSFVNFSHLTSSGFTITWGRPVHENGDLRNYSVILFNSNGTIKQREHVDISSEEMSFYKLNPGICYSVTIAAVNDAGEGTKMNKTVYTREEVPSNVSDLTTLNTSSTSLLAKWSKPLPPNGVITKYEIIVKKEMENKITSSITLQCRNLQKPCPDAYSDNKEIPNCIDNKENKEEEKNEGVTCIQCDDKMQYNITNLKKYTAYDITVTAFTAVGKGNGTTDSSRTSEDKPSPPGQPEELDRNINSVNFLYHKPQFENGIITNQEIELTYIPYNVCYLDKLPLQHIENKKPPIERDGDKFNVSLSGLKPFWKYRIRVRVSTYAGFSKFSNYTTFQTLPTTPDPVSNITVEQNSSRHIYLSWIQPCHPNGIISNYTIEVANTSDLQNVGQDIRFTNNNSTSFNVTNLHPYRSYFFIVKTQVHNVSSMSNSTTSAVYNTSTEAPHPLGNIKVANINYASINISWVAPGIETGPTNYIASALDKFAPYLNGSCETQGFTNNSCIIHGLDAYWPYSVVVHVIVEQFPEQNKTINITTLQSAPGKVSHFSVTQDSNITAKTNVHIEWNPPAPRDLNGVIKKYYIQYWYKKNQKKILPYGNNTTKARVIVKAEEKYTFQIFAETIKNATEANYLNVTITINPGAPLPPSKQKAPLISKGPPASDDQTQIAVAFSQAALCNNSNGQILQWYIIVSKTPGVKVFRGARVDYSEFIQKTYKKWGDVYEKDVNIPYIASDSWNPHCKSGPRRKRSAPLEIVSYTLGSDGDCESGNRKYCNGNLEPGQTYRVRYAVCTAGGCLESEFSEPFQTAPNHVPAIAGSLTAVVLVLAVIIVVIIILKRRGKGPFKSLDNGEVGQQNEAFNGVEMKGTSKPKAVKIADFANYVQKLHADSNLLFSSEYKLLKETCPTHTTKAAEVQVNRIKNRYTNILSYDHSRVKLLPTEDDEGSDYINANYMPGYSSPREYIATQGPLPFTRDDFWRMIWEQNVSIIVMLTQLVERGRRKCDIYWPEAAREPVYYGDLVVELESESTLPDYVLRVMSIKLGDTRKTVKQFAYLAWPDMGIPETSEAMLKFAKEVRSHLPPPATSKGPMVVHCSAGVGRTGTFIAVDYLMQHVRTSDVIDIYSYVMKMRNNRPNMVQTEDQYVFIHDCIKDYVNKNDDDTDDEEEEEEKQEDQSIYMNV